MYGTIFGDITGSVYEGHPLKSTNFPLFGHWNTFTDDTVLTVAVAEAIVQGKTDTAGYTEAIQRFARLYPRAGYGGSFRRWMHAENPQPCNSWGNGSAMRVSPVGWAFDDEKEVLRQAELTAAVTHNHPEGIKGAQAVALAVFLARNGVKKDELRSRLETMFGYDLQRSLDEIRPEYHFEVSCQKSVPESIIAFLEADSVEMAARNAISLGGDADTQAAIAAGIAEAHYGGVGHALKAEVDKRLTTPLALVLSGFVEKYSLP